MRSPVREFLPSRTGRSFLANLPKPATMTSSPRANASAMEANMAPTTDSAAGLAIPASPATRSAMSRLFIAFPPPP